MLTAKATTIKMLATKTTKAYTVFAGNDPMARWLPATIQTAISNGSISTASRSQAPYQRAGIVMNVHQSSREELQRRGAKEESREINSPSRLLH